MPRFEINPTSATPISPDPLVVTVGDTIVWDVMSGAGYVRFVNPPDPVHFIKKDAQPGNPAIAVATKGKSDQPFDFHMTAGPVAAPSGGSGGGRAAGGSAVPEMEALVIRARLIIR
jgi:hypothetical protein